MLTTTTHRIKKHRRYTLNHYHRVIKCLAALIFLLTLNACTQNRVDADNFEDIIPKSLRLNTAVSTGMPGFALSLNSKVNIVDDVELKIAKSVVLDKKNIDFIQSKIQSELINQKKITLSTTEDANYLLSVHIVYGNSFNAQMLAANYGIAPSLTDNPKYQKGTLILMIKNQAGQIFWRGAVQIYGDAQLAPDIEQKRLYAIIASLIRQIPSA